MKSAGGSTKARGGDGWQSTRAEAVEAASVRRRRRVAAAASQRKSVVVPIRGIEVKFPFEPYQLQKVYMERVLQALQDGSNALLESPTGTGKVCCFLSSTACQSLSFPSVCPFPLCRFVCGPEHLGMPRCSMRPPVAQTLSLLCASMAWLESIGDAPIPLPQHALDAQIRGGADAPKEAAAPVTDAVPRIVYASRTHTQLSQVVQELKHCGYTPRVSMLASREQLCVHRDVSTLRGVSQAQSCQSLKSSRG